MMLAKYYDMEKEIDAYDRIATKNLSWRLEIDWIQIEKLRL